MTDKEKIKELEERIEELERRPLVAVMPFTERIIIVPPYPEPPPPIYVNPGGTWNPWNPWNEPPYYIICDINAARAS